MVMSRLMLCNVRKPLHYPPRLSTETTVRLVRPVVIGLGCRVAAASATGLILYSGLADLPPDVCSYLPEDE